MLHGYAARLGRTKILCAAALVGLLLASFGTAVRAAGHQSPAPIVIGASLSFSGDNEADGLAFKQGYTLWADAVNAHGGLLGRPVKLIMINDASSPTQVATNYQKLITVDHCDLLFGPFSSLLTKPASVVAHRYGYAFMEGAGGGPSACGGASDWATSR